VWKGGSLNQPPKIVPRTQASVSKVISRSGGQQPVVVRSQSDAPVFVATNGSAAKIVPRRQDRAEPAVVQRASKSLDHLIDPALRLQKHPVRSVVKSERDQRGPIMPDPVRLDDEVPFVSLMEASGNSVNKLIQELLMRAEQVHPEYAYVGKSHPRKKRKGVDIQCLPRKKDARRFCTEAFTIEEYANMRTCVRYPEGERYGAEAYVEFMDDTHACDLFSAEKDRHVRILAVGTYALMRKCGDAWVFEPGDTDGDIYPIQLVRLPDGGFDEYRTPEVRVPLIKKGTEPIFACEISEAVLVIVLWNKKRGVCEQVLTPLVS